MGCICRRAFEWYEFRMVHLVSLGCLAGVVLVLGGSRVFAEPAPQLSLQTLAAVAPTELRQPQPLSSASTSNTTIVIKPLNLRGLTSAAFADWEKVN